MRGMIIMFKNRLLSKKSLMIATGSFSGVMFLSLHYYNMFYTGPSLDYAPLIEAFCNTQKVLTHVVTLSAEMKEGKKDAFVAKELLTFRREHNEVKWAFVERPYEKQHGYYLASKQDYRNKLLKVDPKSFEPEELALVSEWKQSDRQHNYDANSYVFADGQTLKEFWDKEEKMGPKQMVVNQNLESRDELQELPDEPMLVIPNVEFETKEQSLSTSVDTKESVSEIESGESFIRENIGQSPLVSNNPLLQKNVSVPFSTTLNHVIEREMSKQGQKMGQTPVTGQVGVMASASVASMRVRPSVPAQATHLSYVQTDLFFLDVSLSRAVSYPLSGLFFDLNYSSRKTYSDAGSGLIEINDFKLGGSLATVSGVVRSDSGNHIPTHVDVVVEKDLPATYTIPMLRMDDLEAFLREQNILVADGGFVLVDLDLEHTSGVKLFDEDEKFVQTADFYFDENFQLIKTKKVRSGVRYALFLNVSPGKHILDYERGDYFDSRKIIFVEQGELYFDFNKYLHFSKDTTSLFEETPQGMAPYADTENLTLFNQLRMSQEMPIDRLDGGPNQYEVSGIDIPYGSRSYYNLKKEDGNSFLLGKTAGKEKIFFPTEQAVTEYTKIYKGFEDLEKVCVVQINLPRPAINIEFKGRGERGEIYIGDDYLDKNAYYKSFSPESKRAFLWGEFKGVIDVRVDYYDNTSDVFQTYCALGTYIVEQL